MLSRSFAALSAGLIVVGGAAARTHTTAPDQVVSVKVRITDSRITISPLSVPRGVEGRFVIDNVGEASHNFTLETASGASASPAFTKTVAPHRRAVVRLFLDYRGRARYLDRLPADRKKPGMRGFFLIR